jgi:threonine synthase
VLYVTTRNDRDAFTANRALRENRCALGGHYLPFRHPRFSREEMDGLLEGSSGDCIAFILNLQFGTKLTGRDVDLCIGRHCTRVEPLQHRLLLAECWHTPGYRFSGIVQALNSRITGDNVAASGWMQIAVRIGILFGIFSDLRKMGIWEADISCLSGDFLIPISAWYARQWGLPIRNLISCCNENNSLWELICHGQMRTDAVSIPTFLPAADIVVPEHLERLIRECGGVGEILRYLEICRTGRCYYPSDLILSRMREGMHVSVVGSQRVRITIPAVYKTHGRLLSCATALSYAGALDQRAKTGLSGYTLIWSEESPVTEAEVISEILNIPAETVAEHI